VRRGKGKGEAATREDQGSRGCASAADVSALDGGFKGRRGKHQGSSKRQ
jgi:hypothetical protein